MHSFGGVFGYCVKIFTFVVSLTQISQERHIRSGSFWYQRVAPDLPESNVQQNCTIMLYILCKWRKCVNRFNSFRDKTTVCRTVKFGWVIEFMFTRGNVQQNIEKVIREKSYVNFKFLQVSFFGCSYIVMYGSYLSQLAK